MTGNPGPGWGVWIARGVIAAESVHRTGTREVVSKTLGASGGQPGFARIGGPVVTGENLPRRPAHASRKPEPSLPQRKNIATHEYTNTQGDSMRLPHRLPEHGSFKPTLKSIPEEGPLRPPRNSARETAGLAAEARKPLGFDQQRFVPPTRPGPQGHVDINWPSAPLDSKTKPQRLAGTDAFTGKPMAYDGPPVGAETGSKTFFQSTRNQLAARTREARIAHLTFPENRGNKGVFELAKHHEEQFTKANKRNIQREIQAGHRDDAVPMQRTVPPSLAYRKAELPISGPISGKPIGGPANAKVPANPEMPRGNFAGLEGYRNEPGAGPHRGPRADDGGAAYRMPLHLDRLVQLDDMVNAAATALVNRPGRASEKEYKQGLSVRDRYETQNRKGIDLEKRSGAWNESPIIAGDPDYRRLAIKDGFVESKQVAVGRRVQGGADASAHREAPGVSAYAHGPVLEALQARLSRLRGERPPLG